MTLNQIISRVRSIALAHKQVRTFKYGLVTDQLSEKTLEYPAVFLQDNGGTISLRRHTTTINYKLFFVDLVHVSQDTKTNETDVHSDMISVAMDILAQLNHGIYTDWRISNDNNLQLVVEQDGDMHAGVVVDVTISTIYTQNTCAAPMNEIE